MKKFKFRFQVVLTKVAKEMEQISITLANQQKELKRLERILKGFMLMLDNYFDQFKKSQEKSFLIEELILYQRFLVRLQADIKRHEERVEELKAAINETRRALIEKNKEKKMLEKLKEADYQEFITAIETAEQKLLDELATLNYNRQEH